MKIVPRTPCLVTGASSGIGRELALELGRRRCRVALVARSREALETLAGEIDHAGGEGLPVPADVTSEDAVAAAVQTAVDRFGALELVVANAGQGRYAEVAEQPAEHVESTIGINYVGMTRTVRYALPHLLAAAPAHVVGITSSAGIIPHATASAYCASKAASNAYLAALRLEVLGRGVGVSWICPGVVETPFLETADLDPETHLPRLARWLVPRLQPEDVARAAIRAVEGNKSLVVIPWMMRFFTAFRGVAPRLGDWVQRVTG